ncbi:unnamed protein product, partial [Prorocentrum cordatum]
AYGFLAGTSWGSPGTNADIWGPPQSCREFTVQKPGPFWTSKPFEKDAFHFGKAPEEEVIGYLGDDRILINISPCGYGHALLVPSEAAGLPQVMTEAAVGAAMRWVAASRPDFRAFYNSLSAWSSVNHLHIQGHYLRPIFEHEDSYPVERAPRRPLGSGLDCTLEEAIWPAACVVVSGAGRKDAAWRVIQELHRLDIPHNVVFSSDSIFIFPRRPQTLSSLPGFREPAFHLSAYELSGLALADTQESFEALDEEGFKSILMELIPEGWPQLRSALTSAFLRVDSAASECKETPFRAWHTSEDKGEHQAQDEQEEGSGGGVWE